MDEEQTLPSSGRGASSDNDDHPQSTVQPPQQLMSPNGDTKQPKFKRRASITAINTSEDCANGAADAFPIAVGLPKQDAANNTAQLSRGKTTNRMPVSSPVPTRTVKSIARLCGSSRTRCGYCAGARLGVLREPDEFNKMLRVKINEKKKSVNRKGDADVEVRKMNKNKEDSGIDSSQSDYELDEIDENSTSKSYGLLFDHLPYDTYSEFINRGWRRSGKHLYRPHNFESCCPAISIRLDVKKFSPDSPAQSIKSSLENKSELANTVLVGGSKSQRRVGRNLLRALEKYNSKVSHAHAVKSDGYDTVTSYSLPDQQQPHNIDRSLVISSSSHTSVYASHVARMQINDDDMDLVEQKLTDNGKAHGESICHKNKKSRRYSPLRFEGGLDKNTSNQNQRHASSKAPSSHSSISLVDHQTLQLIEKHEQPFLDSIARIAYQSITREAKNIVGQMEYPQWAWWNNNDKEETATNLPKLPKWCSFKIVPHSFKAIAHSKTSEMDPFNDNLVNISLMVSTAACAAASGRSRGMIDKDSLARAVVASLKDIVNDEFCNEDDQISKSIFEVQDITLHEKSGHVQVVSKISRNDVAAIVEEKTVPPILKKSINEPVGNDEWDPIAEFLLRDQKIRAAFSPTASNSIVDETLIRRDQHQHRFLTVRMVPVHESSLQPEVHELFCRYQSSVHGDFNPFEDITLLSSLDESKADDTNNDDSDEYTYYQKKKHPGFLNVNVSYSHLDECNRSKIRLSYVSFYRFLCETPLGQKVKEKIQYQVNDDGYDVHMPYGTYHQQYRLSSSVDSFDGPLIAVGVVDLLPQCLSSVYAFYDPKLSQQLELGKYTALREIEWVRRATKIRSELCYYYLGYYIHSCQKMIYKAEYKPSELLCPKSLKWVDFEAAKKKLEKDSPVRHCCALYDDASSSIADNELKLGFTMDDIVLDIGGGPLVCLGNLNEQGRELIDPIVGEFVNEVGLDMCKKFIIKLA